MNLKKLERYLRENLLGAGPSSYEKKNLPGRGLTKVEKQWSSATLEQCFKSASATFGDLLSVNPEKETPCS